MQALVDFFVGFGDVIKSLFTFVIDTVKDLIYVIGLLGQMIIELPNMIGWLPSACIAVIVTIFSIVVIYKIVGREG